MRSTTRIVLSSRRDKGQSLRFGKIDRARVTPGAYSRFVVLHSDGVKVRCHGRVTLRGKKAYVPDYNYMRVGLGDARPVEIVSIKVVG